MIGIFDSGDGGLSVFREIFKILPEQKYAYYGDNAFCPYGDKSVEYIRDRADRITEFLLNKGAQVIVVACNTATAAAISYLREEYSSDLPGHIKFIGMEPAVKPAALGTVSGVIGVLATAGTLKGSKYLITKEKYEDSVRIEERVGQGWVELVEKGCFSGPEAEKTVRSCVGPLLEKGADTIVLGCTHYPLLEDVVRKVAGPGVRIIDPAPAVAKHLVEVLRAEGLIKDSDVFEEGSHAEELRFRDSDEVRPADDCSESASSELCLKPDIKLFSSGDVESLLRVFRHIFPTASDVGAQTVTLL